MIFVLLHRYIVDWNWITFAMNVGLTISSVDKLKKYFILQYDTNFGSNMFDAIFARETSEYIGNKGSILKKIHVSPNCCNNGIV